MKLKLPSVLKFIACVAWFIALLPIPFFIESVGGDGCTVREVFFHFAIIAGGGLLAVIVHYFFYLLSRPIKFLGNRLIFNIITMLPIVAAGVIGYQPTYHEQTLFRVFLGLMCAAGYFTQWMNQRLRYDQILNTRTFIAMGVPFVFAYVAFFFWWYQNDVSYPDGILIVLFFILIACYAIAAGQGNIDRLMRRGGHRVSDLPPKIRYYSLGIVSIIFVVIAAGYLLRNQIARATHVVAGWMLWLVNTILILYNKFVNALLIASEPPGSSVASSDPYGEMIQQKPEGNPFWMILTYAIIAVIVIVALIKIVPWLIRVFGRFFAWLGKFARKFFSRESFDFEYGEAGGGYSDSVETLERVVRKPKKQKAIFKDRKKALQKLLSDKSVSDAEKARACYGFILDILRTRPLSLEVSDTPMEITKKLKKRPGLGYIEEDGLIYDKVRYAMADPTPQQLERIIADAKDAASAINSMKD